MSINHVTDRVEDLLKRVKVWMTLDVIAERLGCDKRNVNKRLRTLILRGSVERRGCRRELEYRARLT